MTDTVAACRAALEKACRHKVVTRDTVSDRWIDADDAAACMARFGAECLRRGRTRGPLLDEVEERDQLRLAALAAAQGRNDG